jgi:hypothetical protein
VTWTTRRPGPGPDRPKKPGHTGEGMASPLMAATFDGATTGAAGTPLPHAFTASLREQLARDRRSSGQTCPAFVPNATPCGSPGEDGPGNPKHYCSRCLDVIAGEQEAWEDDEEFARRRRMLCPERIGYGLPGVLWCPEPPEPDSDDGFCVIHNPAYNPQSSLYDAEAAASAGREEVPCLHCEGEPGCPLCAGSGRTTLQGANQHPPVSPPPQVSPRRGPNPPMHREHSPCRSPSASGSRSCLSCV